jgi:hypothetical protein
MSACLLISLYSAAQPLYCTPGVKQKNNKSTLNTPAPVVYNRLYPHKLNCPCKQGQAKLSYYQQQQMFPLHRQANMLLLIHFKVFLETLIQNRNIKLKRPKKLETKVFRDVIPSSRTERKLIKKNLLYASRGRKETGLTHFSAIFPPKISHQQRQ